MLLGFADVSVLDAAERTSRVGGSDAYDSALRTTFAHLHTCPAHAQSCLRTLSRLQRNTLGKYTFPPLLFTTIKKRFTRLVFFYFCPN